jgi:hypothetical protein
VTDGKFTSATERPAISRELSSTQLLAIYRAE